MIDLYTEQAPTESKNFLKLCKAKYYNFAPFYNIQKDFIVELGDPLYPIRQEGVSAWGQADPENGKAFKTKKNKLPQNKIGAVSFISQPSAENPDQGFATSLITITLKGIEDRNVLKNGVVFGQVIEGLEVLEAINDAYLDEDHRPLQDIRIHHTYILEDPFDDIKGLVIPPQSPEPSAEQLSTVKLGDIDELDLEEKEELTEAQIKEKQAREAEAKALTLEIIGDLPSAEVKPMENVLFVCKLNPLTRDDDLEIIFSRFGKIISCEVVRDTESGASLQYAFIEYEDKRSCEAAYFKMDNVLIDDRRIHVDFSQSVSHLSDAWRNKTNAKRQQASSRSDRRSKEYRPRGSSYRSERDDRSRYSGSTRDGEQGERRYKDDRYRDSHRSSSHLSSHRSSGGERRSDRYREDKYRDERDRHSSQRSDRYHRDSGSHRHHSS